MLQSGKLHRCVRFLLSSSLPVSVVVGEEEPVVVVAVDPMELTAVSEDAARSLLQATSPLPEPLFTGAGWASPAVTLSGRGTGVREMNRGTEPPPLPGELRAATRTIVPREIPPVLETRTIPACWRAEVDDEDDELGLSGEDGGVMTGWGAG